ncbi:MAG: glycoside hydrolase family 31 protein, partial [Lachnospiraceae bacterium]
VRNFWLDEAEPEIAPYDYENLRYWLGNGMQVSSLYPFYYAKNFYDGQKAAGQKDIVNLIRSAFIGSQRFGVVLWSGDIMADFDSLRRQIKTGLHAAMSGIPWWTTDIGGFHGGDVNSPKYRECFIRWFQFGAFCPVFRMHGFRNRPGRPTTPPYCLDGFCPSGGPNELWSYGEEAYEILKKYVQIRENLRPYIFKHLQKASQDGTPLMRPLFYDFPEEKNYGIFDEYMFGPDLMVCPIYEAGCRERSVYLPMGSAWIDAASGREYEGGSTISVEAPLARIPLFLRKGGTITEDMLR